MNPHTSEHVDECDAEQLTSSSTSYAARTELMETNGAAMTVSTSAMSRVPSRATNTKDDQGSQTANPESDEKVLQSKDIADSGEPPHDTGSTDQLVQPRTEQTKSYNYRKEPDPHEVALKEVMQIFRDAGVPEFSDVEEDPSSDRWSPRVMSKSNPTTTFTMQWLHEDYCLQLLVPDFRDEITLYGLGHPNILSPISYVMWTYREEKCPLLLFPDCSEDHTLYRLVKTGLKKSQVFKYLHDVLCALECLHDGINGKKLVHGSLYLKTVKVNRQDVAYVEHVGDVASHYYAGSNHKTWEQRATIPPEASHPGILREPAGVMWLFGSLILLIFGDRGEERYPYPPSDCQFCKIVNAIKREHNLIKPLDMKIPDSVWKFVLDKCLVREPSKRISAAEAKPYIKQFMEEAAELEERQTLTARTAAKDVEDAGGSTECPKTGIVDSAVVTLHAPAEKAVSEERQTPTAGTVAKDVEDKGPPTKRPEASVGESTILAPLVPVENAGSEESQTLTARTLAKDVEDAGRSTECSQTITGNSAVVIPGAKSSQKTWRRRLRRCIWRC